MLEYIVLHLALLLPNGQVSTGYQNLSESKYYYKKKLHANETQKHDNLKIDILSNLFILVFRGDFIFGRDENVRPNGRRQRRQSTSTS